MIRSVALALVGGYRSSFEPAEDMDLWLRLSKIGELANLDEKVLRYRVHAASITRTDAAAQAASTALALVTARFAAHVNVGVIQDGVGQDKWRNIEARLAEPTRYYAREAYLRALSLNGGIVSAEDLALLHASLPALVCQTDDKRVLAFAVTRAAYQLCRTRQWREARRLTLSALGLFPISVVAELSACCAVRMTRRLALFARWQSSARIDKSIPTVRYRRGAGRLAASIGAAALLCLAIGALSFAQRAIDNRASVVNLDLDRN
jgi:hypothetical protein